MPWCKKCDSYNSREECPCKPYEVFEVDVDLCGGFRSKASHGVFYAYGPDAVAEKFMEYRWSDSGCECEGLICEVDGETYDCEVEHTTEYHARKRAKRPLAPDNTTVPKPKET